MLNPETNGERNPRTKWYGIRLLAITCTSFGVAQLASRLAHGLGVDPIYAGLILVMMGSSVAVWADTKMRGPV